MLRVLRGFLQAGLDQVIASYGWLNAYLIQGLGLTQADIYVLRAKMVYYLDIARAKRVCRHVAAARRAPERVTELAVGPLYLLQLLSAVGHRHGHAGGRRDAGWRSGSSPMPSLICCASPCGSMGRSRPIRAAAILA